MNIKPWIEQDAKSGHWVVRWRDHNGKKHRDEFNWENKNDAKRRKNIIIEQCLKNALGIYREISLAEASAIFRQHIKPKLANDLMRDHCDTYWNQINQSLGNLMLSHITYQDIVKYWESFLERGCRASTANRSLMWIHNLYERFYDWNQMVPEMMAEKVNLPERNPAKVAKGYLGRRRSELQYKRDRILSKEERHQAREWCEKNCPELWPAIYMGMLTSLRKSDLLALKAGRVNGIQGKTQRPFDLPIILEKAITLTPRALRGRWDRLRADLGWKQKGTPLHTTWHDLRHCGPTVAGELGFSSKHIQELLGHATEQQSKTYTNIQQHVLAPMMDAIKKELDAA